MHIRKSHISQGHCECFGIFSDLFYACN